jgi:parallel beta-helix repeat protein
MSRLMVGFSIACAVAAACGGSSAQTNCADAGTFTITGVDAGYFVAGQTTEAEIAAAFSTAPDGGVLRFGPGTFVFTNTLTVNAAKNVTITGAGTSATILDFANQMGGTDGIDSTDGTDGLVLTDFTIQNAAQNDIRVAGSNGVSFLGVNATWTGPNPFVHGSYGLYPIMDQNVLIDGCTVTGAADTGIYVGQSDMVIVRNNTVSQNVGGIEIENTYNADVHDNTASDNTAGILVFDLPDLPQQGGHNVRVFDNSIVHNNTMNFAAPGNIPLAELPAGTGFLIVANHDVEVFGNTIEQNHSGGLAVFSYVFTGLAYDAGEYYPYPASVSLHDNDAPCDGSENSNGTAVDLTSPIGLLLYTAGSVFPGGVQPSMLYDGLVDPVVAADAGTNPNPMQICFSNNDAGSLRADGGATGFENMHFDQFNPNPSPGNLAEILTQDLNHFTCQIATLPAISFPSRVAACSSP